MGLWVEERKVLSRAAEGEVAVPTLGPVFSFLPSSLLHSLPLWKRCPGLRGYAPSWIFNKDDE